MGYQWADKMGILILLTMLQKHDFRQKNGALRIAEKHDMVHNKKRRQKTSYDRNNGKQSTIWCTKKCRKKTRFGARRNKQNMSWMLHEEMQKE